jgi:hypothetical protein
MNSDDLRDPDLRAIAFCAVVAGVALLFLAVFIAEQIGRRL